MSPSELESEVWRSAENRASLRNPANDQRGVRGSLHKQYDGFWRRFFSLRSVTESKEAHLLP